MSAEPTGGWSRDLGEREPAPVGASGVERFGRYLLCYELAAGGMGTVYLARAVGPAGFDRPVAIKRIHPHLAHQQRLVEMFLDEARITSRVNHPNVCSVFDFGEVDGTYYIALEYLLGESVHALLAELERDSGALDAPRWQTIAARVVADACEGLHAAHTLHDDRGRPLRVVHRDVSPQNLFVTYDGATKVLDFGVARAEDRLHQTVAGDVKGKYAYMAPEQVSGREVDARADVWALGVCLWEMLVGERLFREPSEMDTILAVRSRAIPAPSARRASVSPALDAICLRALERDPAGRWPSARAMGRALEEALRNQPMPTGLADVADWMRARFARRRTRKRELVETVLASSASLRAQPAGTATPSLAPPAASVPPPPPRPRGGARRRSAGTVTPSMAPPARPPRPPRRPTPTATPSVPPPPPPRAKAAKSSVAPPPKRVAAPETAPPRKQGGAKPADPALAERFPPLARASAPVPPTRISSKHRAVELPPSRRPRLLALAIVGALLVGSLGTLAAVKVFGPSERLEPEAAAPVASSASAAQGVEDAAGEGERSEPSRASDGPSGDAEGPETRVEEAPASMEEASAPAEGAAEEAPEAAPVEAARAEAPRPSRMTRRRPVRRPASARGHVNVVTPGGWADVYHRGRHLGRTPRQIELPAGRRIIELRPFGRSRGIRVSVHVPGGDVTRVVRPVER